MEPTRGWVWAALPTAAVLVVDPSGLAPFGPAKWLAVTTLVLVGAASTARAGLVRVARRPAIAWGAFLLLLVIAATRGLDPLYAWTGTPERHLGVLAWVLFGLAFVAGQSLDGSAARAVVLAAVGAAGVAGVWAVTEVLGWEPMRLTGAGDRPVGPFGSSAYLGAAALLALPAAVGVALDGGVQRAVRRCVAVCAVAAGAALVASGARAAWFGALAVASVATAVLRRRIGRRLVAGAGGAVAVAVVVAFAAGVAGRVPDLVSDREGGARGRLDEWRVASKVIAQHPLTGTGPEGYRIAFGRAVDDSYERAHGRDPLPDRAHSAVLDVAVTTGVPGAIAYAALLLCTGGFLARALRGWSSRGAGGGVEGAATVADGCAEGAAQDGGVGGGVGPEPWVVGAAAGVVGYAVQSLLLFPIAEVDVVAWLLAGIVVGRVAREGEVRTVRIARPVAVGAVALALASVAFAAGVFDVLADRDAKSALAAVSAGVTQQPGDATKLRPDALRYRLVAARVYASDGTPSGVDRAIAELDRAFDFSPRDPVVRSERARLMLERARRTALAKDVEAARDAYVDLLEDDPRNAQVLLRAGVAFALAGDALAAEKAWLAAEHLAPRSAAASANLAVAYARDGRWDDAAAAARRALERDPSNTAAAGVLRAAEEHGA